MQHKEVTSFGWLPEQATSQLPAQLPEVAEPGSSLWVTLPSPRTFGEPEEAPKLHTPGGAPLLFFYLQKNLWWIFCFCW